MFKNTCKLLKPCENPKTLNYLGGKPSKQKSYVTCHYREDAEVKTLCYITIFQAPQWLWLQADGVLSLPCTYRSKGAAKFKSFSTHLIKSEVFCSLFSTKLI